MKCRICGCKQDQACPVGCGWATEKGPKRNPLPICTVCADFKAELDNYFVSANRVTAASLARLLAEVQ